MTTDNPSRWHRINAIRRAVELARVARTMARPTPVFRLMASVTWLESFTAFMSACSPAGAAASPAFFAEPLMSSSYMSAFAAMPPKFLRSASDSTSPLTMIW